jgi:hypothetical protein
MNEAKITNLIRAMTPEELKDLASRIFCPIRCGGCHYDNNGKIIYIIGGKPHNSKQFNDVLRSYNPKWSDEQLKPYFLDEDK